MWKEKFVERLYDVRKKNIVLFGVTQISGEIIRSFPEYNIIGVLDTHSEQSRFEGVKILSYEETLLFKVEIIVLAKQLISDPPLFCRLKKFCMTNDIYLADIYDNDLIFLTDEAEKEKQKADRLTKSQLLKKAEGYDVLSFDIFDTLLMRKTLVPEDVFTIIGSKAAERKINISDFKDARMRAQLESGLSNPNIYEIYDCLQETVHISDEQKRELLELEIETEEEVLIPRAEMVSVLRWAKEKGKKVILVSDMYIPESILRKVLKRNDIEDFDALYISCDYKRLKLEGLFEDAFSDENGQSILHIGDSYINDGICAGMIGIDYCLVCSAYESMIRTPWKECLNQLKGINDRSILGLCISHIFNNPFILGESGGELSFKEERDFGYSVMGPVIVSFLIWMLEKVAHSGIEKILFASRDGYIVKKLYDYVVCNRKLEETPSSLYFYTSRKVAVISNMANEAIINLLIDISRDISPKEMIVNVFGLDEKDVFPCSDEDYESPHPYVWKHVDKIFDKSEITKKRYYRYMGNVGLQIGKKYAFFDFVSSGTCQKSLLRYVPFDLCGYYFAWNSDEDKSEYGIDAFYDKDDVYFMENYKIIEMFMTSYEPSVSDFDENGQPVFSKELRSEKEIKIVKEIHEVILDYGKDFFDYLYIAGDKPNHKLPVAMFSSIDLLIKREYSRCHIIDDWKKKKLFVSEIKSE